MFYFRINKIKLLDNRTGKGFLGLGGDKATVQLWSLIITGNIDLPCLDELMKTTDAQKKQELVAQIVQQVAASRRLTPIESVKDNMTATFGDTGYVLFQTKEIPQDFNWQFTAIKLNDKTRDLGAEMLNVINHKDFGSFANNLPALVGSTVNPAYTAAVEVGKFIFTIIGSNLAKKKDKQLGLLYMSLDRPEHYPHGVRNSQDVVDLTGNMYVDYAIFAYDEDKAHP
jgi:hypothetical protein